MFPLALFSFVKRIKQTNNNEAAQLSIDRTVKLVIFAGGDGRRRSHKAWNERLDKAAKRLPRDNWHHGGGGRGQPW